MSSRKNALSWLSHCFSMERGGTTWLRGTVTLGAAHHSDLFPSIWRKTYFVCVWFLFTSEWHRLWHPHWSGLSLCESYEACKTCRWMLSPWHCDFVLSIEERLTLFPWAGVTGPSPKPTSTPLPLVHDNRLWPKRSFRANQGKYGHVATLSPTHVVLWFCFVIIWSKRLSVASLWSPLRPFSKKLSRNFHQHVSIPVLPSICKMNDVKVLYFIE